MVPGLEQVSVMLNQSTDTHDFGTFVFVVVAFLVISPLVLIVIDFFSVQTYFVVSFIWFLISREVFGLSDSENPWLGRLKWVKLAGWMVFVYIVFERVVAVLG